MKKILLASILITINSCYLFKSGLNFEIYNNSNSKVENIKFYTSEKLNFTKIDKIESKNKIMNFLSMRNNKADGHYILEFNRKDGRKEKIQAGYYTNGSCLNNSITFEIQKDTTYIIYN